MAPPSPSTNSCSQGGAEQLSKTNLYIRGLPPGTTDQDLIKLCQPWVLATITVKRWQGVGLKKPFTYSKMYCRSKNFITSLFSSKFWILKWQLIIAESEQTFSDSAICSVTEANDSTQLWGRSLVKFPVGCVSEDVLLVLPQLLIPPPIYLHITVSLRLPLST